jgi:two-component system OmpR family response regulator
VTARDDLHAPGPSRTRNLAASWWGTGALGILLADEDPAARAELPALVTPGVRVTVCADGAEALWHAGRIGPAVVILSATLPVVSAAEVAGVLARHREGLDTIAVGVRVGEADRAGPVLVAGAGRVVSRPYRPGEIEPLLRECLERRGQRPDQAVLTLGPLHLDGPACEARVAGRPMRLTLREFELLRLLMVDAGRVVPHQRIRRQLGEARGKSVGPDAVAVHVRRLRMRLAGVADILAVRGLGYRLRVPTDERTTRSRNERT